MPVKWIARLQANMRPKPGALSRGLLNGADYRAFAATGRLALTAEAACRSKRRSMTAAL